MDVAVLNRGQTVMKRPLPAEVTTLIGDVRDEASLADVLGTRTFDVIVNFIDYTAEHVATSIRVFRERASHYVHISSAGVYQKPPLRVPFTESTPRRNPFLQYSRDKIAAEDAWLAAYQQEGLPVTIVRPAHTYDEVAPPLPGGWTVVDRICRGAEVVVHGDGTSLWTLTHARDFAVGLVGLLGNPTAVGEVFHVTSEYVYTWNQIYEMTAAVAGVEARLVHIPSEFIQLAAPDWPFVEALLGEFQWSIFYDNSKVRRYVPEYVPRVPFEQSVAEFLGWRADHEREAMPDAHVDAVMERLVSAYHATARVFASAAPSAGQRAAP
jgi:nucleoside-diphosphate-sugar epimerase